MPTDKSIPYPRPDYTDGDLLAREMSNGTFTTALLSDIKSFRVPMDRYNVTEDKLTEISLIKGNIKPEDYDISMTDVTLDRVKELGWQPAKRPVSTAEPELVYNPLDHYSFVEWAGINSTDLPNIQSDNNTIYTINDIYYDDENAGLFGFLSLKDEEGNVTDRYAMFFSLNTLSLSGLGRLPDGLNVDASRYVGYVKGAYILNFYGGTYVSFDFHGNVYTLTGYSDHSTPLGDDGCLAIEGFSGNNTFIMNPDFTLVDQLVGRFCVKSGGFSTSPTRYPFGTKINGKYYFLRDADSSYKFNNTLSGWKAEVIEKNLWMYSKRLKYDFATDNWLHKPLKTLKYNTIRHGLIVPKTFPDKEESDEIELPNSDMYGDFLRVTRSNGSRNYFHTFDFKNWESVTGDAATHLYGCSGRVWLNNRDDGVSGVMPYTVAVKSVNDFLGSKKTVLQFSGFIFRGGM